MSELEKTLSKAIHVIHSINKQFELSCIGLCNNEEQIEKLEKSLTESENLRHESISGWRKQYDKANEDLINQSNVIDKQYETIKDHEETIEMQKREIVAGREELDRLKNANHSKCQMKADRQREHINKLNRTVQDLKDYQKTIMGANANLDNQLKEALEKAQKLAEVKIHG